MIFAQNNKPKLEAVGDLVKATSFHDNGRYNVGFLKWETTRRMGFLVIKQPWQHMITEVRKCFLNDTVLSEVDYSNNVKLPVKKQTMPLKVIADQ
jgi:hypothetical protein